MRSEAGSYDFFKNYIASGHVLGPFDYYVGYADTQLTGYREHSEQSRDRVYSTFGYQLPGGTTMRLDFTYVNNKENLPGSDPAGVQERPSTAQPGGGVRR